MVFQNVQDFLSQLRDTPHEVFYAKLEAAFAKLIRDRLDTARYPQLDPAAFSEQVFTEFFEMTSDFDFDDELTASGLSLEDFFEKLSREVALIYHLNEEHLVKSALADFSTQQHYLWDLVREHYEARTAVECRTQPYKLPDDYFPQIIEKTLLCITEAYGIKKHRKFFGFSLFADEVRLNVTIVRKYIQIQTELIRFLRNDRPVVDDNWKLITRSVHVTLRKYRHNNDLSDEWWQQEAEDLSSTIFLKLREHFEKRENVLYVLFKTYIDKFVFNSISDWWKKTQPLVIRATDYFHPIPEEETTVSITKLVDLYQQVARKLRQDYHEALINHYLHGLTHKEIGQQLGKSESATQNFVARAVEKLNQLICEEAQFEKRYLSICHGR